MTDLMRRVLIKGRVQGVGYRAWVAHRAMAHRLGGWVRNRRDGSVEAVFAGPEDVVRSMIAECRRGPPAARVETVSESAAWDDQLRWRADGEDFSVLGTA